MKKYVEDAHFEVTHFYLFSSSLGTKKLKILWKKLILPWNLNFPSPTVFRMRTAN